MIVSKKMTGTGAVVGTILALISAGHVDDVEGALRVVMWIMVAWIVVQGAVDFASVWRPSGPS